VKRLRTLSTAKKVTLIVTLLGVLGSMAGLALAAPAPATPTVSSGPANPTTSTSATFTFTDTQSGVTFQCSRDGAAFSACASGQNYSGLAQGSHTFQVEAIQSGKASSPASYTWTIDLTPPTVTFSSPVTGGSYNLAGWNVGCTGGAGVCGTAADPSGVSSVQVSIKQNATGKYWSGSGWVATAEIFNAATGTTGWGYPVALPQPDGSYSVHVRATDGVGNVTSASSYPASTFTTDTVPPASAPAITSKPASNTSQTSATFAFGDTESGVAGFLCRVDYGYLPCSSPSTYSSLADGNHTFSVEAVDAAGNAGPATSYGWTVDRTPPPAPTFTATPPDPSTDASASFAWSDGESNVTYLCSEENGAFSPCSTPLTYNVQTTNNGQHWFAVEAVDAAGNVSPAASTKWKVGKGSLADFSINGNAVGLLYPGTAARPLSVTLSNPNSTPIYVTAVGGSVSGTGLPAGCGTNSFQVTPATIPSAGVQIPANGSVTLPTQGATVPTIQMVDTHTDQTACQHATLTIAYTGSAHS
jgi:hypothetical protein